MGEQIKTNRLKIKKTRNRKVTTIVFNKSIFYYKTLYTFLKFCKFRHLKGHHHGRTYKNE